MCPHNSVLFTCVYLCPHWCFSVNLIILHAMVHGVCVSPCVFFGVMLILLHARVYGVNVCTVNPIILIRWLHVVNVC